MIGLIQRVSVAKVETSGVVLGEIGRGLMVLVGVEREDGPSEVDRLAAKLVAYRVFPDDAGKMNKSVRDAGGSLLLVPQFTLAADTSSGLRPSFSRAAPPALGAELFTRLATAVAASGVACATGRFGADMQVTLTNDGPVTFWLQVSSGTTAA
ncbi:MAG: D-aminoacyl-tRNA deacylase [Gammaproteobacteria bacterium]